MRKIVSVFFVSFLILFHTITSYAYNPTELTYTRLGQSIFFVQDAENIPQIDFDMWNYAVAVTPAETLDLFKQEDVKIYLTHSVPASDRSYYDGYYNAICYGPTVSYNNADKKITSVSAPVSIYIYSNTQHADAYIHECGHAFEDLAEYITGYYLGIHPISGSSEWQTLYSQYGAIMATFDASALANVPRNACEGFAEAYRLYYVYPTQLFNACPGVYNFVAQQISKYQSYLEPITYENFNYTIYYYSYPDVAAACGLDKDALWDHYVNHGKAEGRYAARTYD